MKTLIGEQEKITVTKNELLKFKMPNKKIKYLMKTFPDNYLLSLLLFIHHCLCQFAMCKAPC